jgi:hypothetical protein
MSGSSGSGKDLANSYLKLFLVAQDNFEKVCAQGKDTLLCKHGRRRRQLINK